MDTRNKVSWFLLLCVLGLVGYYIGIGVQTYQRFGWESCLEEVGDVPNTTNVVCFPTEKERQAYLDSHKITPQYSGNTYINNINLSID